MLHKQFINFGAKNCFRGLELPIYEINADDLFDTQLLLYKKTRATEIKRMKIAIIRVLKKSTAKHEFTALISQIDTCFDGVEVDSQTNSTQSPGSLDA